MTAVERYNALNGRTVNREELQEIMSLAKIQGQTTVSEKIKSVLAKYEDPDFEITVSESAIDTVPIDCLSGMDCIIPDEEFTGLEKGVSPNDIYQMITDKMVAKMEEASGKGYKSKWKKTAGYLIPFNFESKKPYRGINSIMLYTPFVEPPMQNPFFLTFNQIEKNGGKLKQGSKGIPIVYFTQLYKYQQAEPDLEFGTYDFKKMVAWLKKNMSKIPLLESFSPESIAQQNSLPILKYYNVFKGEDVEGIDFNLDNFKIGFLGNGVKGNNESRNQIADLIVENYPAPKPKLIHEGERAFFMPSKDIISMPKFEDFETGNDYYRTLFHEITHSTGIEKRLNRKIKNKFGSKDYAKEELVAEFGSVFSSAHAGIIWYNNDNHAEYLKNWSLAIEEAKEDNRFIMRAASKGQEAADFILNLDKNGIPEYQKALEAAVTSKTTMLAKETKNKKSGSSKKKKPDTNELLEKSKKAKIQAKTKTEFEKGLKKAGFETISYSGTQESPQEWSRQYKLNYKDVAGLTLDLELKKLKKTSKRKEPEFAGISKFKGIGLSTDDYIYYDSAQEFYEEVLAELRRLFDMTVTEAADMKKQFADTLFQPEKQTAQLGLFGTVPANLTLKGAMEFAEKNIIGKSFFVKALGEEVFFNKGKLKKAMNHPRGSKENLALVYKLPMMLEKAVLLTEQPDKKKRQEIKKVFKLILIEELFGEIYRVLITVRKQDKNYYYDHSIIDKIKPEKQDGSVNDVNPIPLDVASPVRDKYKNKKNTGLKSPVEFPIEAVETVQPEVKPVVLVNPENSVSTSLVAATKVHQNAPVKVVNPSGAKSLSESMKEAQHNEVFEVPGDIGRFLGKVEIKPVHSVVTTLDAEQGAGKTRIFFQIMNVLAGTGKECLFISLEEHPASKLFKDKVSQYIEPQNLDRISVIDEVTDWKLVRESINQADIIFIDSFQKLPELDLDNDIRKSFNGKWFFIIYQQTGTKSMRGGSKAAFDGDQILKVFKDPEDYRNNYVYANKNRYNDAPDLKLNIFTGKIVGAPEEELINEPANSREPVPQNSGRLIATPIF